MSKMLEGLFEDPVLHFWSLDVLLGNLEGNQSVWNLLVSKSFGLRVEIAEILFEDLQNVLAYGQEFACFLGDQGKKTEKFHMEGIILDGIR